MSFDAIKGNKIISKNKLGMSALISHPEKPSVEDQIRLFADVGFDSFFLSTGVTDRFDLIPEWASLARGCGMDFEAVHHPTGNVDAVWTGGEGREIYERGVRRNIEFCSDGEVSKLVLHVGASSTLEPSESGLELWRRLERYAELNGVRLCYENSTSPAVFEAVARGAGAYHGVCHDIGHQSCYTPQHKYEELFGNRLIYTHLHDNIGEGGGDLHLLPGDGIIDFGAYFERLRASGYGGTLNLELSCYHRAEYREMSFESFVRLAYERLFALTK